MNFNILKININHVIRQTAKHAPIWIASILTCYGLFLRLRLLHTRQFWGDEIYQFQCMQGTFKPFWFYHTYGDYTTFPGEYILHYPLVSAFGMNKWMLALPHLLLTVLGFYLLFLLCRIYMRSWVGFTVAFLIYALNDNLIFHSLEFRPYAVLPVAALGSLYIAHRLSEGFKTISLPGQCLTALLILFIINYHAYGILVFTLPLIFVLITTKRLLPWRFLIVVLTLSLSVWLWYASYNHLGFASKTEGSVTKSSFSGLGLNTDALLIDLMNNGYIDKNSTLQDKVRSDLNNPSDMKLGHAFEVQKNKIYTILKQSPVPQPLRNTFDFIPNPLVRPLAFLKAVVGNLIGNRALYFLLIGFFLAFVSPSHRFKKFLFLFILVMLPLLLILYVDVKSHYWYLQRQFIWVMGFFSLWIGWAWDGLYLYILKKNGINYT